MFGLDIQQFTTLMLFVFSVLWSGIAYLYHQYLHRLPATQQALLSTFVDKGVKAAEQALEAQGNKKQYALNAIETMCKKYKVSFDPIIVGDFIEAAVHELKTLVPASAPVVDVVDTAVKWLNDVPATTSATPSNTSFPQGFLPVIPQSMPGSSQ